MPDDCLPQLINLLQTALNHPVERSRLLQQPEKLREIANDIPARRWLFEQALQSKDSDRVRSLIVAIAKSSKLIWRGGSISPDIYDEALSRTWVWFMENLQAYKPETASFITWFNHKLRWIIQDILREISHEQDMLFHPKSTNEEDGEWIYPPAPDPDRWHETTREWLDIVKNHPHHFRKCRSQRHPHINCEDLLTQILMVLKDSGEVSWEVLARSYQVEPSTLKRFCQTRCFPCFKQLLSD